MKVYLCTFATPEYAESAEVLRHSALTFGGFDGVFVYNEDDLVHVKKTLPDGLVKQKRGCMLWSWKPHVIADALRRVEDGDVVVYCDAAMFFMGSIRDLLPKRNDDVVLFRNTGHRNRDWCKRDCFVEMDCDETPFHDAVHINAAIQIYRKTFRSVNMVDEYIAHCSNEKVMDDIYRIPNYPGFVDHRHDQSVLTNLSVIHALHICVMDDTITQFGNKKDPIVDHHRQKIDRMVRATVITPTIGAASLERCMDSVQAQTLMGVTHLIVVDGPEHAEKVSAIVEKYRYKKPVQMMVLPTNTGKGGWYGHRVYAAIPHLVNTEYVAYLDEDNWYEPDHLHSLMIEIKTSDTAVDWAFSLRNVYDANGTFVTRDNCESLGSLCHTVVGSSDFLIDTSCMLLSTKTAVDMARHWYNKYAADRVFTKHILAKCPNHRAVTKHSVNYTTSASPTSVQPEFFVRGNELSGYDFSNKKTVYVFHFNRTETEKCIKSRRDSTRSYALDEWQITMLRDVARRYNVVNGFAMEDVIPPGSTVFVSLCMPHMMPAKTLARKDILRIGYTAESPNIRHREQWTDDFLKRHFDRVLTYWTPVLDRWGDAAIFCPHNTHHLDFTNPLDEALLSKSPSGITKKNVCMILERRPSLVGTYSIDFSILECQDPLREHYVRDLSDITVYGVGWDSFDHGGNPGFKIGHSMHRSQDPRSSVAIMRDYTFVIIIENTNADGYVSEKIYDAFIAGVIPIYYGNNNDRVGIPRDMYIDLKQFKTSRDLDAHIQSMTAEDVRDMQIRILEGRRAVLERVSIKAFADAFDLAHQ